MTTTKNQQADIRFDGDIARDVYRDMKADIQVPDDCIQVSVSDGIATLSGMVRHEEQKRAAERCARTVSGVRDVINQIAIDPASAAAEG
jgi:osmotically-inducible protein OsmY